RDATFRTLLDEAAPTVAARLEGVATPPEMRGWGGLRGYVRRAWGEGWALVGDAGVFRDPISSHGMTDAMRDAEILAGEVLRAWSGAVPESVALGRYQALRDRLSFRMFELADRIACYDWGDSEIRRLIRGHSSAMSDEMDYLSALPNVAVAAPASLEDTLVRG
ncbi:NAD(P)/FAD-dependent oxidoreductase, partial [Microbacterium sp. CPCC 204701]|uniref:NAD(P)/FAD-dependent oxidoreductase n=1 Tax=Microbacterium sp. CPCC 204701 TaxID=2493084 RepID=UPI00406CDD30